jgi:squalene synthase HpnD
MTAAVEQGGIDAVGGAAAATEQKASGSSFYAAMRLLPKAQREAMFAIYTFCRAVDDIADDGEGTREERRTQLDQWRTDIASLYGGAPAPQAAFLKPFVDRYGLRRDDFLAVIDGMEMDVIEDIIAPDLAKLDLYCERVASAVGRLSIKAFGMDEDPGFDLAHHLGRALQLTNILRDIDEDAAIGRLYLPSELIEKAGISSHYPAAVIADPRIDEVCRAIATMAHERYQDAERIMAKRPRGLLRAPRLMDAVYREILRRMEQQGWAPPRERVKIGKAQLLLIIARHGFG